MLRRRRLPERRRCRGASTVDVTLQKWAVVIGSDSVPAGAVTFNITNDAMGMRSAFTASE
ncbi:MAG: hypothetical protein ABIO99_08040 [Candidatus Limnocylindria bacterium]